MEIFYYGWIERLTTDQEVAGSIGYHVCLTHRRTAKSETDSAILAKYKISLSFQQNSEKTTKALMTRVRFPVNAFAFMAQSAEHPPNKAHWSSSMILALGARAVSTLDFESNNSSSNLDIINAVPRIRTWVESATTTYTKPLYENGQNHFIYISLKSINSI
ncbi:hypothetical protein H8356DRAFT_1324389 [Neocallimastix lanati (nom. inval.)]|nr:hypothetical protein H8356DRAFT_1324389 [Neocallimastix sp. JGI-2020a]